jgi:hypothetical protein
MSQIPDRHERLVAAVGEAWRAFGPDGTGRRSLWETITEFAIRAVPGATEREIGQAVRAVELAAERRGGGNVIPFGRETYDATTGETIARSEAILCEAGLVRRRDPE